MRPANRLDGFYNQVKEIHKKCFPDWRFGQLMINFMDWVHLEKNTDIFFYEEPEILDLLRRFASPYMQDMKKKNADINTIMDKLAQELDGNLYGSELVGVSERELKENGIVVVFGYSDDNAEFCGAIDDEIGCFDGGLLTFTKDGFHYNRETDSYDGNNHINAIWYGDTTEDSEAIPWTYETDIPHKTFMIYDENEPWCRGIIFNIQDLI